MKKKIMIKTKYQKIPEFSFDAPRIGQVLDNLITNAIKFSPIGGVIQISTQLILKIVKTSMMRFIFLN